MESVELNIVCGDWNNGPDNARAKVDDTNDETLRTKASNLIEQNAASCTQLNDNVEEAKKKRPESGTKTIQKLKSSFLNGTKTIRKETASLLNTVGTWTNSMLKHDKGDDEKYFGIVEKKTQLAQKMKHLLKIGDDEKNIEEKKDASAETHDKELHAGDN